MFQDYLVRIKVRLNADLTHYQSGLQVGLIGYTIGNPYKSDTYNAVIDVDFEDYGRATIVLDKLDIIDEEYLNFLKKREQEFLNNLDSATDIKKVVGPRGGFKMLSFHYQFGNLTFYDRSKSLKIENEFKKLGKVIQEIVK